MTYVSRLTASGVVLQELAQDDAGVQRALTQIDDRFVLWPPDGHSPYYRVMCRVSDDQPALPVVTWMDANGDPAPLSSGLIDEVQKWRPENRSRRVDADEHNQRHVEQAQRLQEEHGQAVIDDHRAKVERGRVTVGMSTRPLKPGWQRTHLPGGRR